MLSSQSRSVATWPSTSRVWRALVAASVALLPLPLLLAPARAQNATPTPTMTPTPTPTPTIPTIRRELRGVWIATVSNIDWPSKSGLPVEQQKAELVDLFDRAKALHLNAVFFQVRPAGDALYESKLEPWSEYLSGEPGKAPSPYYDPLALAVQLAHERGMELHAWFNPYRAHIAAKDPSKVKFAPNHLKNTRPDLVRLYGKSYWMDPSEKEVQQQTTNVILDVVRRYDIDGVHFDDYFYPYQEKVNESDKNYIEFPDQKEWDAYQKSGGKLTRSAWRRENVNTLVGNLSVEIKKVKPWVRFGISPFGIWRPGYPAQIKGLDSYGTLYADSRKWLQMGWVDYLAPQLYWKIETPAQSYPVLLNWWLEQNPLGRGIYPGLYTDRATSSSDGKPSAWDDSEIEYQIRTTRGFAGAGGTIHFSAKSLLLDDQLGLTRRLGDTVYNDVALPPASPWLKSSVPVAPIKLDAAPGRILTWRPGGTEPAWQWAVQYRLGTTWSTAILPGAQTTFTVPGAAPVEEVAVSQIDRVGNQSAVAQLAINAHSLSAIAPTPTPAPPLEP